LAGGRLTPIRGEPPEPAGDTGDPLAAAINHEDMAERRARLDLLENYKTNPPLYPTWQQFMRDHQPKTLIFWGQGDVFFTPEGGEAYLRDLPDAEMHRLNSGHFAVEDHVEEIASDMARFYRDKVAGR
jgi:pimeloyl-ACP methyl ester carboxylesterase